MKAQIDIVHEDLRIVQAFKRVSKLFGLINISPIVGSASISNILFVDPITGNDGTAIVGSLVNKFQTIQGALNRIGTDAIPNRVVFIAPGSYAEVLTIPPVDGITLQGSGVFETFINNIPVPVVSTIKYSGVTKLNSLVIKDMSIPAVAAVSAYSIDIDGVPSGGSSFANGLIIQNVRMLGSIGTEGSFFIRSVNNVSIENSPHAVGNISNVGILSMDSSNTLNGTTTFDYDDTGTTPSGGKLGYFVNACILMNVIATNLLRLLITSSCRIGGTLTCNIIDSARDSGEVNISSKISGDASVLFTLNVMDQTIGNFDFAEFGGKFDVKNAAGSNRAKVSARNSVFTDSLQTINAGNLADLDIRGAIFDQSQLTSAGSGTINRSIHRVSSLVSSIGVVVGITPPFNSVTPPYSVNVELDAVAASVNLVVGIDAKLSNQFTGTSNNVAPLLVKYCIVAES